MWAAASTLPVTRPSRRPASIRRSSSGSGPGLVRYPSDSATVSGRCLRYAPIALARSADVPSRPITSRKTIAAISGSVMPASVWSATLASTPCSSSKARCQAVPPAPPVIRIVPSMSKRTARISLPSLTEQLLLAEPVEEGERGQDDDRGDGEDDDHGVQGGVGCRRLGDRQRGWQQIGELGDGPAPDHGDDGADRERAQSAPGAPEPQPEAADAAGDRDDHQRQALDDEPVVGIAGVGVGGGGPRQGGERGGAGGGQRAAGGGGP